MVWFIPPILAGVLLLTLGCTDGDRATTKQENREQGAAPSDQPAAVADLTTEQLEAMGYLSGYEPAPELSRVTVHDPDRAYSGLNLYNSGHGPEAILMDMVGTVLHTWRCEPEQAFPVSAKSDQEKFKRKVFWRRVHLYPNGDLLAIFTDLGLIKIDRNSNLIWAARLACHHDIFVDEAGRIYLLSWELKTIPRIHGTKPVLEDFITILAPDGVIIRQVSLLEAFENSSYASLLETMPEHGDIFHTNTIEVFDGSLADQSPLFQKGNVLISVREINTIAIVDLDQEKVVWALTGRWRGQHQPTLLANGHILLFDNLGHHGVSKVIELDPFSEKIRWAYKGDEENGFFSKFSGSNQRLSNGNTLITESNSGRAFEITRTKHIVWEFYNSKRAGKSGRLIATLFDMIRLPPDYADAWLRTE